MEPITPRWPRPRGASPPHGSTGLGLTPPLVGTLAGGMAIYHWVEGLPWADSFLNAAMLLGGMGPVDRLHTTAGKWLAGSYALFAGLVFASYCRCHAWTGDSCCAYITSILKPRRRALSQDDCIRS